MTDQLTPEQQSAIRRAALARRDYVLWLAKALERRAADWPLDDHDADLVAEVVAEIKLLLE